MVTNVDERLYTETEVQVILATERERIRALYQATSAQLAEDIRRGRKARPESSGVRYERGTNKGD